MIFAVATGVPGAGNEVFTVNCCWELGGLVLGVLEEPLEHAMMIKEARSIKLSLNTEKKEARVHLLIVPRSVEIACSVHSQQESPFPSSEWLRF
jgi:hypothetical protein